MTSLAQLIEEMRVRLAETSTNETVLVRSLSDALRRMTRNYCVMYAM